LFRLFTPALSLFRNSYRFARRRPRLTGEVVAATVMVVAGVSSGVSAAAAHPRQLAAGQHPARTQEHAQLQLARWSVAVCRPVEVSLQGHGDSGAGGEAHGSGTRMVPGQNTKLVLPAIRLGRSAGSTRWANRSSRGNTLYLAASARNCSWSSRSLPGCSVAMSVAWLKSVSMW